MTGLFVELFLRGAALSLLAALVLVVLRRAAAAYRHLVCAVALVGLLALPLAGRYLPPLTVRTAPESPLPPTTVAPPFAGPASAVEEGWEMAAKPGAPVVQSDAAPSREPVSALPAPAPTKPIDALPVVWALGAALLLLRLTLALRWLKALYADSRPATVDGVAVRLCDRISTPLTWGIRRPVVLLPAALADTHPEAAVSAVRHETAHVARWDWAWHLMAEVVCALCWFQPGAWWLRRRLRAESERACDDRVLLSGIGAPDYAAHLVELLRRSKGGSLAPGLTSADRLEARVRHLLDPSRPRRTRAPRLVLTATLAAMALPLAALKVAALPAEPSDLPAPRLSNVWPSTSGATPRQATLSAPRESAALSQPSLSSGLLLPAPMVAPLDTDTDFPLDQVVWRKGPYGLEPGILLYPHVVPHDAPLVYRLLVRNVTDKPIAFRVQCLPRQGGDLPFLIPDGEGLKPLPSQGAPDTGLGVDAAYIVTLAPHEAVVVPGTFRLYVGAGAKHRFPRIETVRSGKHWLEQPLVIHPVTPADRAQMTRQPGAFTVTVVGRDGKARPAPAVRVGAFLAPVGKTVGAQAPVEILPPPAVASLPSVPLHEVVWSPAVDGLQPGLLLGANSAPTGAPIAYQVLLRNAGRKPISFLVRPLQNDDSSLPQFEGTTVRRDILRPSALDRFYEVTLAPGEAIVVPGQGKRQILADSFGSGTRVDLPGAGNDRPDTRTFVQSITVYRGPDKTKLTRMTGRYTLSRIAPDGRVRAEPAALVTGVEEGQVLEARATVTVGGDGIVWGDPDRGLQCGIRLVDRRQTFRYGDLLQAEVFYRNVSQSPMTVAMPKATDLVPTVADESGHAVRLDMGARPLLLPLSGSIDPGEVRSLGVVSIEVLPEGAPPSRTTTMRLAVAPGRYRIRANGGVRYPDGPMTTSADALFAVAADRKAPAPEGVAWGKAEGGLQWGVRRIGDAQPVRWHEAVQAHVFVRNVSNAPIDATLPDRLDLIPVVRAAGGRRMTVERGGRFDLGPAARQRLEPGAAWRAGRISLTILREGERAVGFAGAVLPPGEYHLGVTSGGVRLEGGTIPFTVDAGGEIAWGIESGGWRYGLRDAGDGKRLEVWAENRLARPQTLTLPVSPPEATGILERHDPAAGWQPVPLPDTTARTLFRRFPARPGEALRLFVCERPANDRATVRWRMSGGETTGSVGLW